MHSVLGARTDVVRAAVRVPLTMRLRNPVMRACWCWDSDGACRYVVMKFRKPELTTTSVIRPFCHFLLLHRRRLHHQRPNPNPC